MYGLNECSIKGGLGSSRTCGGDRCGAAAATRPPPLLPNSASTGKRFGFSAPMRRRRAQACTTGGYSSARTAVEHAGQRRVNRPARNGRYTATARRNTATVAASGSRTPNTEPARALCRSEGPTLVRPRVQQVPADWSVKRCGASVLENPHKTGAPSSAVRSPRPGPSSENPASTVSRGSRCRRALRTVSCSYKRAPGPPSRTARRSSRGGVREAPRSAFRARRR